MFNELNLFLSSGLVVYVTWASGLSQVIEIVTSVPSLISVCVKLSVKETVASIPLETNIPFFSLFMSLSLILFEILSIL